jgi:indolepyruvate ferredoxin oxidoreductase
MHTYIHTHTHTHTQDCGKASNCVAVTALETSLGRKRKIDQTLCTQDTTCVKGFCPSFVTVAGGVRRKHALPQALRDRPLPDVGDRVVKTSGDGDGEGKVGAGSGDILVCGVGGTGVVTVAALLGIAAHIQGRAVNVFDQIGLSQKGGPVVSHVRILGDGKGDSDVGRQSTRISDGAASVVLACDMITALLPHNLACIGHSSTRIVANSAVTLPGSFARNPDMHVPVRDMVDILTRAAGGRNNMHAIDFTQLTQAFMGDAVLVNVVMLGYALQAGALPVSARALDEAVTTLGVAVQQNLEALELGRRAYADTQYVLECAGMAQRTHSNDDGAVAVQLHAGGARTADTVKDLVGVRSRHLQMYQDDAYAKRYTDAVSKVAEVERTVLGDACAGELAEAAARGYHKVLAYKDEYEVRVCISRFLVMHVRIKFVGNVSSEPEVSFK